MLSDLPKDTELTNPGQESAQAAWLQSPGTLLTIKYDLLAGGTDPTGLAMGGRSPKVGTLETRSGALDMSVKAFG